MKKLLFIVALMALGTVAFGEAKDPTKGPQSGDTSEAQVLVKAQITDDSFTITDVYGKPLILDFGKLAKNQSEPGKVWTAEVEYKITATKAPENQTKFWLALEDEQVSLKHVNNELKTTLKANLALDKTSKVMAAHKDTVTGFISGSISENISAKETGMYKTTTTLTAVVE